MSHACYVCNFESVPDGDGVECPHCHRLQYGSICAKCGQPAPTIVRSFRVYCTACSAERGPLAFVDGKPINLVGTTSRWGGRVARALGWGGIVGGGTATVIFAWLASFFFASATDAGLAAFLFKLLGVATAGGAIAALIAVIAGIVAVVGGRRLGAQGDKALAHARENAIHALAANRGGILTATEVAAALNLQVADADAILTGLAKQGSRVGVEVDANGVVHYVFREVRPQRNAPTGVRVDPAAAGAVQNASSPAAGAAASTEPETVREKVDREYEQLRKLRSGPS